jgi:hypothetical protein
MVSRKSVFGKILQAIRREAPPLVAAGGLLLPLVATGGWNGGQSIYANAVAKGVPLDQKLWNIGTNVGNSYANNWKYPVGGVIAAWGLRKVLHYAR